MATQDETFVDRYGPWALVIGASEGVGAAYARALAERGLDVVLVARRQAVLDELASSLRDELGVDARTAAVDLSLPGAMERLAEATDGLDVGMVMYCAGADPNYEHFLDVPVEESLALVQRNCVVPLQVCHHFARPMVDRGRGGIVLVSSGAALLGRPRMVAYSASKAFDMLMAESLWTELNPKGVDVLSLVLAGTDTPALRRLLAKRGNLASPDDTTPIPGIATPDEVVAEALENLTNGPTWFVGEQLREGVKVLTGGMGRSDMVRAAMDQPVELMDTKFS